MLERDILRLLLGNPMDFWDIAYHDLIWDGWSEYTELDIMRIGGCIRSLYAAGLIEGHIPDDITKGAWHVYRTPVMVVYSQVSSGASYKGHYTAEKILREYTSEQQRLHELETALEVAYIMGVINRGPDISAGYWSIPAWKIPRWVLRRLFEEFGD